MAAETQQPTPSMHAMPHNKNLILHKRLETVQVTLLRKTLASSP